MHPLVTPGLLAHVDACRAEQPTADAVAVYLRAAGRYVADLDTDTRAAIVRLASPAALRDADDLARRFPAHIARLTGTGSPLAHLAAAVLEYVLSAADTVPPRS